MMGFGMMIGMVLFWVVVVGLALWLLDKLFPRANRRADGPMQTISSASETALDIAKQRYARGEITKTEYDEIRRALEV